MKHDLELLRSYVHERSEAAFTELVQRHLPLVYSVSLRRVGGDAHLAEDVAQRVFLDPAPTKRAEPAVNDVMSFESCMSEFRRYPKRVRPAPGRLLHL